MCILSSLAQGREDMKCVLVTNANMDAQGRENMKCVLEKIGKEEGAEKKGKEKTDEDSSVLLYFMTEEGERE